jgi:UDP-GlcNAc:undecaprenyl-phosphate GlcNAc-1-phosphate transferase
MMLLVPLTAILGALLVLWGTPVARRAALAYGITDRPDGRLKNQRAPVPYLGGLAVASGVLVPLAITFPFSREVVGILLAGMLMVLAGLIDDLGGLTPGAKLTAQALASVTLIKAGVAIQIAVLPDSLSMALSFVWFMVMANAINLIDVSDGLAASVSAAAAGGFLVVALVNGNLTMATLSAALLGALLGFLPHNDAPAKIYLGDSGSLFIGITLGALATFGRYTGESGLGLASPLLILAVPLFEMAFISYARQRRGMSILRGSHDHFALRLRRWRLTARQAARAGSGAGALCAVAGIGVMLLPAAQGRVLLAATVGAVTAAAIFLWRIGARDDTERE